MIDLINRQMAIDALGERPMVWTNSNYEIGQRNQYDADRLAIETVPSVQPDAEFINWLLDEVWDEELWELNYRAFPELLCRRLVKAGWLKEEGGKYVRLDK